MLESRNHSKSGVKLEELMVERSSCFGALSLNLSGVIGRSPFHGLWRGRFVRISPLQHKKSWGIIVGHDLLRFVSSVGCGSSYVRGRVQFSSLLLRTDQANT